jgi:hypothetical protein
VIGSLIGDFLPWIIAGIGFAASVIVAWFSGKKTGNANALLDRERDNAKSAKDAKDNRHEIETSDDQRLVDILTGKLHNKR